MKPFITFPEFLCLVLSMKAVYIHAPSVCFMRIVGEGVGVEECVPTSESSGGWLLSSGVIIPGVAFGEL